MVITTHRPAAIATAIVAAAAVLGLWISAEVYVSSNANFCTQSCHTAQSKHAAKLGPGHAKVACQACHVGGRRPGLGLIVKGLFGIQSNVARHGALDETTCTSCHSALPNAELVKDTQGHRQHGGPRQPVECLKCHRINIHGGPPTVSTCTTCHAASKLHARVSDADNCLSCHNFSVTSSQTHRLTIDDCGRCHGDDKSRDPSVPNDELDRARRVTPSMLHGSVDCKMCHQPHRQPGTPRVRQRPTPSPSMQIPLTPRLPSHRRTPGGWSPDNRATAATKFRWGLTPTRFRWGTFAAPNAIGSMRPCKRRVLHAPRAMCKDAVTRPSARKGAAIAAAPAVTRRILGWPSAAAVCNATTPRRNRC